MLENVVDSDFMLRRYIWRMCLVGRCEREGTEGTKEGTCRKVEWHVPSSPPSFSSSFPSGPRRFLRACAVVLIQVLTGERG